MMAMLVALVLIPSISAKLQASNVRSNDADTALQNSKRNMISLRPRPGRSLELKSLSSKDRARWLLAELYDQIAQDLAKKVSPKRPSEKRRANFFDLLADKKESLLTSDDIPRMGKRETKYNSYNWGSKKQRRSNSYLDSLINNILDRSLSEKILQKRYLDDLINAVDENDEYFAKTVVK